MALAGARGAERSTTISREASADVAGAYAADVARGHLTLCRSCIRILLERTAGPTLTYAVRYGHVHLGEVLTSVGTDSTAVVQEWFQAFLEPRGASSAVRRKEIQVELAEPEPDQPQQHGAQPSADDELAGGSGEVERSYQLSPWRARSFAAAWLERQAEHGRSKQLVPELLELEERLREWSGEGPDDWRRGLWQLV